MRVKQIGEARLRHPFALFRRQIGRAHDLRARAVAECHVDALTRVPRGILLRPFQQRLHVVGKQGYVAQNTQTHPARAYLFHAVEKMLAKQVEKPVQLLLRAQKVFGG